MVVEISHQDLELFRHFLSEKMGLHITTGKERELKLKLLRTAATFGFHDAKEFLNFLSVTDLSKKHIVTLAKDLSVGETYFFRHHPTYVALKETILPDIIERKKSSKQIRIWSAGCCTGEEPYSIAILLRQLIKDIAEWNVTILGTDINEVFLQKAKTAIYKEWSFRDTPLVIKESYFSKIDDKYYQFDKNIKKMVKFEFLDLISNTYPSKYPDTENMDLILCNNVLIYFSAVKIKEVIERFCHSLIDQGWLVVSTIETPYIDHPNLSQTKIGNHFFFKKEKKSQPKAPISNTISRESRQDSQKFNFEGKFLLVRQQVKGEWESYYTTQNYEKSAEILEKLLEKKWGEKEKIPELEREIAHLIKCYANLGNILKAKEWCEKGLMVVKVDPLLHYLYGMVLQEIDSYEEASQAYHKALFLDPNFIMVHFALGSIYLKNGEVNRARKHLRNCRALLSRVNPEQILLGTDEFSAKRLQIIVDNLLKNTRV